jgi:hypothetical protein
LNSIMHLLPCLYLSTLYWNVCQAENLVINIENIPQQGVLNMELLVPAIKQEDARPYLQFQLPVEAGNYSKKLSVSSGIYAIRLFLDINNNQKLDTNLFGKPTEPFGFSNNPKVRFKMPAFNKISFLVEDYHEITVSM